MRKHKGNRESLTGLKTTFEVQGSNLESLLKIAKNKGIALFDVKKLQNKRMLVTVNFKESKNFFAIAKELCYNIKKIRDKGKTYPLYRLIKSFGLIVGAVLFFIAQTLSSDVVLSVSYLGDGSIYKNSVQEYLSRNGVHKYSRFSKTDLAMLEDGILASHKNLSFASCKKEGNRLVVELVLAKDDTNGFQGDKYELICTEDGVVESIKVYRGTALVKVGDAVKKGDKLVDGVTSLKDQTVKINVLAVLSLSVERQFTFEGGDGMEEMAKMLAEQSLYGEEIIDVVTDKEQSGERFIYKVTVKIRRIISVG
ncbi:MAG: sporulation protein YqfD [Clostridia bacterium]|nr:sporulation protein YqfD [Clostridia bacterium]